MNRTKTIQALIIGLTAMTLSSCSVYHVNSEDITTDFYPSKSNVNDIVHLDEVAQPHEVLGYVTVNTERNQKISEVIRRMKREAAIMGGDAITNIQSDATGQWKKLPAQDVIGNAYLRANFTATVVRFTSTQP